MIPFFEISVWGFFSFFLWFPRWLFAWYHLLLVPQAFPLQIGPRFQGRGLLGTDSFFVYFFLFLIPKLQSETVNTTVNKKKKKLVLWFVYSESAKNRDAGAFNKSCSAHIATEADRTSTSLQRNTVIMHLVKQDSVTGKLRAFPEQY